MQNIVQSMVKNCFPLVKLLTEDYTNNLSKRIESLIENNLQKTREFNENIEDVTFKIRSNPNKLFLPLDIFEKIGIEHKYFIEMIYFYAYKRKVMSNIDGLYITLNSQPIILLKELVTTGQNQYLSFDLMHFDKILSDLKSLNSYKDFVVHNHESLMEVKKVSNLMAIAMIVSGLAVYGLCKYNFIN